MYQIEAIPTEYEPAEIDFDALCNSFLGHNIYGSEEHKAIRDFCSFLKSEKLTAPVQRELPVKIVWTLKLEFEKFIKLTGSQFQLQHVYTEEILDPLKKYYDKTETPDYSGIPKGSIVEFKNKEIRTVREIKGCVVYYYDGKWTLDNGNIVTSDGNRPVYDIIRVVEWGKE
ncbi:MAG: hypothetical protein WC389_10505 [Lutibacter sp.]